ncbi:NADH-quinone oxidoreductase chain 3 [Aquicella siphonis]|uniref:NADH-quinone oxidoreductase n=1 Tax=Aquicella siphonis TaxID=254247 RepID=A0A5E4PF24_9COXI|nr:NADH-quinone oxidoreductase subunit NuoG [Aquicella siphonis]VVC75215.1 NADH-quinone oxidoreductase chain 3 [Aquicella siphonis]
MADIEIEIDGQKLTAKPNQTVIQVADEADIYIPRFCYHKHLSIPANCRMCLVEVEKSPKALPACATPVMQGMKVFTRSQKTLAAQRAVMEFLLINHPLDCPICDQGGECELQDLSMGYGTPFSHYDECKRAVADENLGPLIATEMTRCILCTRCIRFGDEIAGMRELGMTFRGEHEEVSTFVEQAVKSEVSGNIIDICPVGALTSKPYRFTARAWELDQAPSVAAHDCVGSNLNIHTRYGKVMRVVARENELVNQTWISDRDRFSYAGLYHADRLEEPMVKEEGVWRAVEWQRAFEVAAAGLQAVTAEYGADRLGGLASPNSTLEEFYLLQKIIRGLGSPHVDYRLRETDVQDQEAMPLFPGLGMAFSELEHVDAFLLIGSNLRHEQPAAALRVRKAGLKGASISVVNSIDHDFNFPVAAKKIVSPQHLVRVLAEVVQALDESAAREWNMQGTDKEAIQIARLLQGKQKAVVLLGALALQHPHASAIRFLAQKIAALTGAKLGFMTMGANSAGAWLAGAVPHRHAGGSAINHTGLDAYAMLSKPRKGYVLLNVEPDLDCANALMAEEALKQARFVVALSQFRNPVLEACAHVILPVTPFTETAGTFVNAAGDWQSFNGVARAYAEARPGWKVLRVLGNFLHLDGFDYESSEEVKREVRMIAEKMPALVPPVYQPDLSAALEPVPKLVRVGEVPLYAVDGLVRRSRPLQEAQEAMSGSLACVRLHPETAGQLKLLEGERVRVKQQSASAELPLRLDARVAPGAAWVAAGIPATRGLGDMMGEVELEKV